MTVDSSVCTYGPNVTVRGCRGVHYQLDCSQVDIRALDSHTVWTLRTAGALPEAAECIVGGVQ